MTETMKTNIENITIQDALQFLFPDARSQVDGLIKTLDLEFVCAARK